MASTYLTRSISSTGNTKIATLSCWVKKLNSDSVNDYAYFSTGSANTNDFILYFDGHLFSVLSRYNSSNVIEIRTNRLFRDVSAWYHIVVAVDTTQATASDRVKIYVNGEQETSLSTATYPSQDQVLRINESGYTNYVGNLRGSGNYFNGLMAHFHLIDGTAYDASAFGQADANGVWKIKTSPSVTYGTNGFFILKDGNSVTDQSGNGNNFTVAGGTLTNTEDNPSNVFCTWNAVAAPYSAPTLSEGNTKVTNNGAAWQAAIGTIGVSSGKWYWEGRFDTSGSNNANHGVIDESVNFSGNDPMNRIGYTGWFNADGGEMKKDATDTTADYGVFNTNDIIGIALNMDDKQISIYKNGTLHVSNFALSTTSNLVFPCTVSYSGGISSYNFGNGYFGTTAVSSAGTNASGIGIFEYDVPTGYTALSTKGLNL